MNRILDVEAIETRTRTADGELLRRFLDARDDDAFSEMLTRHGSMVFGVCLRRLGQTQDAEDAFQAVFLALAKQARELLDRPSVGPWLFTVARRVSGKALRSRRRRRWVLWGNTPEPATEKPAEVNVDLDAALATLSEQERSAVILCHFEGLSRSEAAKALGCPEGTLSARLSRALDKLRKKLGKPPLAIIAAASVVMLPERLPASTVGLVHHLRDGTLDDWATPQTLDLFREALPMRWLDRFGPLFSAFVAAGLILVGAGFSWQMLSAQTPNDPTKGSPTSGSAGSSGGVGSPSPDQPPVGSGDRLGGGGGVGQNPLGGSGLGGGGGADQNTPGGPGGGIGGAEGGSNPNSRGGGLPGGAGQTQGTDPFGRFGGNVVPSSGGPGSGSNPFGGADDAGGGKVTQDSMLTHFFGGGGMPGLSGSMSGDPNLPGNVALVDAVKQFNDWAKTKEIGKTQPPLTADEIVAAIRGWDHKSAPINTDMYKVFQEVAETKKLPKAWHLTAFEHWKFNNFDFDVWRIEFTVATKPGSSYTLRIRDQRIRSRSIAATEGTGGAAPEKKNMIYALKYGAASDVAEMLKRTRPGKMTDIAIVADERTNSIAVSVPASKFDQLLKAIQAIDELQK